jgi:ATP-dependent DNA helicase DinG
MNLNIEREITYDMPRDIPKYNPTTTTPLLTAYDCVLMERDNGKQYVYTAINIYSHKKEIISRRYTPLTTSGVKAVLDKIRQSKVAGLGRFEADRSLGNSMNLEKIREIMNVVFNEVLPQHGYTIRKEQIALSFHILEAISKRQISLSEAAVGTGKTLAYLLPAIFAKRGLLNGYLNMSFYTGTPLIDVSQMPIVIATSSIALQKAILKDLCKLSDILLKNGMIKKPLTAVIRKGREHYICERNLRSHMTNELDPETMKLLESLLKPSAPIDIAEIDGINAFLKKKISVSKRCLDNCPYRDSCAYIYFREEAQSADIDIQICNHNYFLADILRRAEDKHPLIPNYQCVIIDEAHKFLSAAQSMYGNKLSYMSLLSIEEQTLCMEFTKGLDQKAICTIARILVKESSRLFRRLIEFASDEETEDDTDRNKVVMDNDNKRHISNIYLTATELIDAVTEATAKGTGAGRKAQLLHDLEQIQKQASAFTRSEDRICWLEIEKHKDYHLCAIPKNIDLLLYEDLWNRGIPTVLTSGTLSAAGDFSRIKQSLGINHVHKCRVVETSKPSPFDYYNKSLLYISENVPFPDQNNKNYILATANEIEQLIYASHGHAAVLFTSYKVMDQVWELLKKRNIPFPFFRLDKGGVREIDRFKQSGNGVLFAAGALWEGIDIPGDALSMLIIVKLPFPVPDPISEYERSKYGSPDRYREEVLKPEMLIKLKQGHGRAIRLEKDTAAIAILDCRAGIDGVYRWYVTNGLPKCYVTSDINDVKGFFHVVKPEDYFK